MPSRRVSTILRLGGLVLVTGGIVAAIWTVSAPVLEGAARGSDWLHAHNSAAGRLSVTVVVLAISALAGVVWWDRAHAPRRPLTLPGEGGTIELDALEWRLATELTERPDIDAATVSMRNRGRRGVSVELDLRVTPDATLQTVADDATVAVGALLHEQLDARLAEPPQVRLHYEELRLDRRRAAHA